MLVVIPYDWGLGIAKVDDKGKATPPYIFFFKKSSEITNKLMTWRGAGGEGDVLLPCVTNDLKKRQRETLS